MWLVQRPLADRYDPVGGAGDDSGTPPSRCSRRTSSPSRVTRPSTLRVTRGALVSEACASSGKTGDAAGRGSHTSRTSGDGFDDGVIPFAYVEQPIVGRRCARGSLVARTPAARRRWYAFDVGVRRWRERVPSGHLHAPACRSTPRYARLPRPETAGRI